MQLRRHGLQLLVLLMTLTATELCGAAEPVNRTFNSGTSQTEGLSPQEIAARVGKISLSDLVTDENAAMLGFKNHDEVSSPESVKIGVPFEVYQVDLLSLKDFDPARDKVTGLLKPMASLIYPLLTKRQEDGPDADAKTRSALVVSQRIDKKGNLTWAPTNWGLALLAQVMTKYREKERDNGFASGFVVWIPSLNLHFLGDQLTENLLLIPLADRKAYGLTKGVPISAIIVFALYALEARSLDVENPG